MLEQYNWSGRVISEVVLSHHQENIQKFWDRKGGERGVGKWGETKQHDSFSILATYVRYNFRIYDTKIVKGINIQTNIINSMGIVTLMLTARTMCIRIIFTEICHLFLPLLE